MSSKALILVLLFSSAPNMRAWNVSCPKGHITVAGAKTVLRQVDAWKGGYSELCPDFVVDLQGGGYPVGAARVCDSHPLYDAVDVAAMMDSFFNPQATTVDGWNFDCNRSTRKAIMLHVGHSGLRVDTAAGGSAAACINLIGGLSIDQLRWIFSSFSIKELKGFKWDTNAVPFSDGDDSTHLWSELHENCTSEEILPVGPADEDSIVHTFLHDHLMTGGFETTREFFAAQSIDEVDAYLAAHPHAIALVPFYNILSPKFAPRVNTTYPVPIMDKSGEYINPSTETFETHDYPLLRRVDLGLNNNPESLDKVRPFLEYALSPEGDEVIKDEGFWPIRIWEKITMRTRIGSSGGEDLDEIRKWCGPDGGSLNIVGSPQVQAVAHVWSQIYNLACPVAVSLQGKGGSVGESLLCDKDADIALMARDWGEDEGTELTKSFVHRCNNDKARNNATSVTSIQIDVAKDGLTVIVAKDGAADRCLEVLGGLTKDQLRWIYSNYTEAKLKDNGWDPKCVKMSDGNPKTHLWSELDPRCDSEEIRLAGDFLGGDEFNTFSKSFMTNFDKDEYVALDRTSGFFAAAPLELLVYLLKQKGAISYVPFHYYVENDKLFTAVPIQNDAGDFVLPSESSITDGTYPIVRSLFMNILNNKHSLEHTIPLLKFGLAHPRLLANTGYVPIEGEALTTMLRRLEGAPYDVAQWDDEELDDDILSSNWLIILLAIAGAGVLLFTLLVVVVCRPSERKKN